MKRINFFKTLAAGLLGITTGNAFSKSPTIEEPICNSVKPNTPLTFNIETTDGKSTEVTLLSPKTGGAIELSIEKTGEVTAKYIN